MTGGCRFCGVNDTITHLRTEKHGLRAALALARAERDRALTKLAAICDAQDAKEDVRPHIHAASAFLLAIASMRRS